jgi:dihydrofolate reductase
MRTLASFTNISLDGYFADTKSQMNWAHMGGDDAEFQQFTEENSKGDGALLFGRITYEMMVSYWPTPAAQQANPIVAERMNSGQKLVFSRTLKDSTWKNTTVLNGDIVAEARKLKEAAGPGIVILGSGSIVSQLGQAGLIDEYQLVIIPVVLGNGKKLFDGVNQPLSLRKHRTFNNGKVFLSYAPTNAKSAR